MRDAPTACLPSALILPMSKANISPFEPAVDVTSQMLFFFLTKISLFNCF